MQRIAERLGVEDLGPDFTDLSRVFLTETLAVARERWERHLEGATPAYADRDDHGLTN